MRKVFALLPVEDFWRPLLAALLCTAALVGLLTLRLGTLTPGFSQAESQQRSSAVSSKLIIDNPLHAPQKLSQFALQKLNHKGPAAMRFSSVFIGFVAIISMFIVLKNWYTVRVAALGTLLFASSSWLLHTARLATPDINFVLPLVLVATGIWLHKAKFIAFATFLAVVTGIVMLYVPGMIWFLFATIVWQRKVVRRALRHLNIGQQSLSILLTIFGLLPLIWSFIFHPDLIQTWLGLPTTWLSPAEYLKNLAQIPLEIFVRGSGDATYGISRLPLLDVFTSFMIMLGVFVSFSQRSLDRNRLLFGAGLVASLLIALEGPFKIAFLMPILYLLAASGIALLLQQWFTIFPRNPVARALGVGIVSLAVFSACYYHLNHYFIAWPNVPATKATFNRQP